MTSLLPNLSGFRVNALHLNACISVLCELNKIKIGIVANQDLLDPFMTELRKALFGKNNFFTF